jgi:hypothetical protein
MAEVCRLYSCLRTATMVDRCEHGNELMSSVKFWGFLESPSIYCLLKQAIDSGTFLRARPSIAFSSRVLPHGRSYCCLSVITFYYFPLYLPLTIPVIPVFRMGATNWTPLNAPKILQDS